MIRKLEAVHTFASFHFPRYVVQLPKGKPAHRKGKTSVCGPYYSDPGTNPGETFSFYLESDFQPFTRWTWCDEVEGVRINHEGWFTDEDGAGETIRGLVVRLPHGRGFLAGWSMGEGMASSLDRSWIIASETEAAHAANDMAERAANDMREYQETERERMEAEEEAETLANVLVCGDGI